VLFANHDLPGTVLAAADGDDAVETAFAPAGLFEDASEPQTAFFPVKIGFALMSPAGIADTVGIEFETRPSLGQHALLAISHRLHSDRGCRFEGIGR
jgi:hypothetical protein